MDTDVTADPTRPYKAVVALLLAVLTAASGIWLDNPYITMGLAAVTALGTFLTPNPIVAQNPTPPDVVDGF